MLASLTGLLLTLGGDQPAVVFDPPLDPEIFIWDGRTLRVRQQVIDETAEPGSPGIVQINFAEPPNCQKIIVSRTVDIKAGAARAYDLNQPSIQRRGLWNEMSIWVVPSSFDVERWPITRWASSIYAGQTLCVGAITATTEDIPVVEFFPQAAPDLEQRIEDIEQALNACQCASDLDGDGLVGMEDLVQLISDWGPCSA